MWLGKRHLINWVYNMENWIKKQKSFVSYNIALLLSKIGFEEEVIATYDYDEGLKVFAFTVPNKGIFELGFERGWCIRAPLYPDLIEWLTQKHNIILSYDITFDDKNWYYYTIWEGSVRIKICEGAFDLTNALDNCLIEVIKFIK